MHVEDGPKALSSLSKRMYSVVKRLEIKASCFPLHTYISFFTLDMLYLSFFPVLIVRKFILINTEQIHTCLRNFNHL